MEKQLLTTKQLMEKLQVSRSSLNRYKVKGMPFIRISHNVVRYDYEEVDAWIREQKNKF